MSEKVVLFLTELECQNTHDGKSYDSLYFKIQVNDEVQHLFPQSAKKGICFRLNSTEDKTRRLDFNLTVQQNDVVKVQLLKQLIKTNELRDDDVIIATTEIRVGNPTTESSSFSDSDIRTIPLIGEENKASYTLKWKLVSGKIPTLRIFALASQKIKNRQIKNHPMENEPDTDLGLTRPLYIQLAKNGKEQCNDAVPLYPLNGGVIDMKMTDKCIFSDKYQNFLRIPIDPNNDVTVEVRLKEEFQNGESLGAYTSGIKEFQECIGKGSLVRPLDRFLDDDNVKRSVFLVCFCYLYEDWTQSVYKQD